MTIKNNPESTGMGWLAKAFVATTAATAMLRGANATTNGFYNHPGNSQFDPRDYFFNADSERLAPGPAHPRHHYLHGHAPGPSPYLAPAPGPSQWGHRKYLTPAPGPAPKYEMNLEPYHKQVNKPQG